jgi:hypothetical protein
MAISAVATIVCVFCETDFRQIMMSHPWEKKKIAS